MKNKENLISSLEQILIEAQRAPSVHNVQPVQVEVVSSQHLILKESLSTRLKVADPSGHDQLVSFGCYLEGLSLALSKINKDMEFECVSLDPIRIEVRVKEAKTKDELSDFVDIRKSFRGLFLPIDVEKKHEIEKSLSHHLNLKLIGDKSEIIKWADLYDQYNLKLYKNQNFITELYSWLRLSPHHSSYHKDGLNAEALSLTPIEARLGHLLLNPKVFRVLKKTPLAKILSEEGSKIKSSWWLVLISGPKNLNAIEKGRLFYRSWLELSRYSVFGCPLSVLVDEHETKQELEKYIPKDHQLVNVLRAGMVAPERLYRSPRVSFEDFVITTLKTQ